MSDPAFFTSFTLIIAGNVEPSLELQLADLLWESKLASRPSLSLARFREGGLASLRPS